MKKLLVACIGVFAIAARVRAQAPVFGPEFQVSITPPGYPAYLFTSSSVANLGPDSNFIVIWSTVGFDGSGSGVVGRRFDAAGTPLGGEFGVNAGPTSGKSLTRVASNDAGNFVATWSGVHAPEEELGWEVRARRFDASGAPEGDDISSISTRPMTRQLLGRDEPGPARSSSSWRSGGRLRRRQSGRERLTESLAAGSTRRPAAGREFQVNQYTTGDQDAPRIARKPDGALSSCGSSFAPRDAGAGTGIMASELDNAGAPLGGEFRVDTPDSALTTPITLDVAVDSDGKAIVVWTSDEFQTLRTSTSRAAARRLRKQARTGVQRQRPRRHRVRPRVAVPGGYPIARPRRIRPHLASTDRISARTSSTQHFFGRRRGDVAPGPQRAVRLRACDRRAAQWPVRRGLDEEIVRNATRRQARASWVSPASVPSGSMCRTPPGRRFVPVPPT